MASVHTQVRLHTQSGLPEDLIINTFNFVSTDTADNMSEQINTTLPVFYEALVDDEILGPWWTGDIDILNYEILDPGETTLGSPIDFVTLDVGTPSGGTLPLEVALCMSFAANTGPGIVAARRRGRVFLGPIRSSVSSGGDGTDPPRPNTSALTATMDAFEAMQTVLGGANVTLAVWSRADAILVTVERGWMDNEFDTIRSRGTKANFRDQRPEP